jgi:hypothetical protein
MNIQSRSAKKGLNASTGAVGSVRYVARTVNSVGGSCEPSRVVQRQPTKRTKRTRIGDQFDTRTLYQKPGHERRPLAPVSDADPTPYHT